MNLSVKKCENRSTFGEVMDNIVVPCFFNSQCSYFTLSLVGTEVDDSLWVYLLGMKPGQLSLLPSAGRETRSVKGSSNITMLLAWKVTVALSLHWSVSQTVVHPSRRSVAWEREISTLSVPLYGVWQPLLLPFIRTYD